jgi:hypothetical protein
LFIKRNLDLELKPFCLNHTSKGLPFLGYIVYPNCLHINKNSRFRFVKKLKVFHKNLENDLWSQSDYQRHIVPLIAFTKKADSYNFRKRWTEIYQMDVS